MKNGLFLTKKGLLWDRLDWISLSWNQSLEGSSFPCKDRKICFTSQVYWN